MTLGFVTHHFHKIMVSKNLILSIQKLSNQITAFVANQSWLGQRFLNLIFLKMNKISLNPALIQKPDLYPTWQDIFVRYLNSQAWIHSGPSKQFHHPVEGYLSGPFKVDHHFDIFVKQSRYKLADFVPENYKNQFLKGVGFIYYLSPSCYHRIHCPTNAFLIGICYQPGFFWPVNHWGIEHINNLFQINERITLLMKSTENQWFILSLVAALNVGQMTLGHNLFRVNQLPPYKWLFLKHPVFSCHGRISLISAGIHCYLPFRS